MDRIVTLTERKAAEAERRRLAVAELRVVLTGYARAHGGRFLLFGSAARGTMRYDSDVDILLDFRPMRWMTPGALQSMPAGTSAWIRTSRRLPPARGVSANALCQTSRCWHERRALVGH